MSEVDLKHFTDKMLREGIFNCFHCKQILEPPIVTVANVGNFCNSCQNSPDAVPNPWLEEILNELKLPCKFHEAGCPDRIDFGDLKAHEEKCKFHVRPCLLSLDKQCVWTGIVDNFLGHFQDCHPENVITNQNNVFMISVELVTGEVVMLLKGRSECILKVRVDLDQNEICYVISYIRASPEWETQIRHIGKGGNTFETRCKSSTINGPPIETKVNLSALRDIMHLDQKFMIEVRPNPTADSGQFDEDLLQYFECPVCKNLMRPPIYQCKFGHSFCNTCRPRLDKCPNCREPFGTTRNYNLEALTARIKYTCRYHELGCQENLSASNSPTHESQCPFKPFQCPLGDCNFEGLHSAIGKHFSGAHPDKMVASNLYRTTVEFRLDQMMTFFNFNQSIFMVSEGDDNIFRLNFKRTSDYSYWAVEVVRSRDSSSSFTYDIGIIDMRKPQRKLIRSDVCFGEVSSEEMFKKCIFFPNNTLASYASNSLITYYCKVQKYTEGSDL